MNIILECVISNNDYFSEGRSYLLVDGTLTCDASDYSTNIYTTDKAQREFHYPLLRTVEDVNEFFNTRGHTVKFIKNTISTKNWF